MFCLKSSLDSIEESSISFTSENMKKFWECVSLSKSDERERRVFLAHSLHLSLTSEGITYIFFAFEIALLESGIAFNRYCAG